jgi:iron complex outermembrane recepter protein
VSIVDFKKLFISTLVLLSVPLLGLAQDEDEETAAAIAEAAAEDQEEERAAEEIVVTGSRIKRDTYSSIAPLQVITGQMSREAGLIDPATILQESSAGGGQQIDLTFQGFVLDNGPGSTTIDLRGLGAGRTLVLIDGRRAAPAGVEGAPFAVDLSLVPASLVQQYDVLLDGASSVYGSDAVAGVTNIILRKDFDGLELESFTTSPDQSGGLQNTVSVAYGKNFDRGFIGIGVEFEDQEEVLLSERSWSAECVKHVEIDQNGAIRTLDLWRKELFGWRDENCNTSGGQSRNAARFIMPGGILGPGSLYYTPGFSNSGVPNFSAEDLTFTNSGLDGDGDGLTDIQSLADYSGSAIGGDTGQLFPDFQSLSVMAYGEYTFDGEMNLTPFFEIQYNERDVFSDTGQTAQFFPVVPGGNPFNICNPTGVQGVDCGLAVDSFWANPNVIAAYQAETGLTPLQDGITPNGAIGPAATRLVWRIRDDRNTTAVDVSQTRFVAGLRGDLPNFNPGSLEDWSFEIAMIAAKSKGKSSRLGIREDRYDLAVGWTGAFIEDPANPGTYLCGEDANGDGVPDGTDGCVPYNMYAPSNFGSGPGNHVGDTATQAERDWLFDTRDFDTDYEQLVISAYATGELFQMPAGAVLGVVGFEYRDDKIDSIPDDVARDGLFFGFFADGGAVGEKFTREYYGEVELPLLANMTMARELNFNASARYTEDEFYGSDTTYSGKLGWRPVDSLLLRGTYGTSFRAPNLRENFLLSQTGFSTLFDPCGIPEVAWDASSQSYIPANETREPEVLANCAANGADPTAVFYGSLGSYSVEVASGGATDLVAETSDSISYGFVFDQPWFESFDLTFGWTYYEIDISNSIIEPGSSFIINDCYGSPVSQPSVFCSRISRDPGSAQGVNAMSLIDRGFINRDELYASGVDINVAYDQSVTLFGRPFDLSLDLTLNHPKEVSSTLIDTDGTRDTDTFQGEFGFPDWRGQLALRVDFSDYRLTWQTRYLSDVEQDVAGIDEFNDIFGSAAAGRSDTCGGPALGDVLCRDVGFADDYYNHAVSLYYYGDVWTIGGGIRNVFEEKPPMVDTTEVQAVRNSPIGYGYDLNGRTYFLNVAASFQ